MVLPKVECKVFKDNIGAIELAKALHMHPQIKYIDIQ
jgi:RimJ/RimL family protein N-acetyltransferase